MSMSACGTSGIFRAVIPFLRMMSTSRLRRSSNTSRAAVRMAPAFLLLPLAEDGFADADELFQVRRQHLQARRHLRRVHGPHVGIADQVGRATCRHATAQNF